MRSITLKEQLEISYRRALRLGFTNTAVAFRKVLEDEDALVTSSEVHIGRQRKGSEEHGQIAQIK